MAKLPEEVKNAIDNAAFACVATANSQALANVVYVGYLKYLDDETIVIADNKFEKTRANIDSNPKLAFVVLDPEAHKAFQVKGDVTVYTEGEELDSVIEWVHSNHPEMTPKAAVHLHVHEVYCGDKRLA